MFCKYNAVLRGFPQAVVDDLMGNQYPTTLHLIVSGVIKLSRCVSAPTYLRSSHLIAEFEMYGDWYTPLTRWAAVLVPIA